MAVEGRDPHTGYLTTGHLWNGINELNTPVPKVIYAFLIATFLFSVIYWVLMPAWPIGTTYTKGLLGIDQRTTVIILGDARSNYGDAGERSLRRIHERARRVLWLNPEPMAFWNSGDSEMQKLGAACDKVESCRSLKHLERVVSEIARTAI